MRALTAEEAAAIDSPHIAPGADAQGAWLGYVAPAAAAFITAGPPPQRGTWLWQPEQGQWVRSLSLAEIKAAKVQELAQAYDAEFRGGMAVGSVRVPTDAAALADYLLLRQTVAEGNWIDTPIQLADGTFQLLTQTQMAALWAALKAHRRTLVVKLRDKIELVRAASTDTAAEVAAITWTSTP